MVSKAMKKPYVSTFFGPVSQQKKEPIVPNSLFLPVYEMHRMTKMQFTRPVGMHKSDLS